MNRYNLSRRNIFRITLWIVGFISLLTVMYNLYIVYNNFTIRDLIIMLLFGTLYALTQLSLMKRAKRVLSAQMYIKNILIHLPIVGASLGVLTYYIYYINCNIFLIILFFYTIYFTDVLSFIKGSKMSKIIFKISLKITKRYIPPLLFSLFIYLIGIIYGLNLSINKLNFRISQEIILYKLKINFLSILQRNILMIIYELIGIITFGSSTLVNLLLNGYILAVFIKLFFYHDNSLTTLLLLILPHGIFEIPAIIIAGAAGFKIPYEIVRYLAGKKEQVLIKEDIKEYLTMALISILLIVIAAWIEANITLKIAKAMLNSTKGI